MTEITSNEVKLAVVQQQLSSLERTLSDMRVDQQRGFAAQEARQEAMGQTVNAVVVLQERTDTQGKALDRAFVQMRLNQEETLREIGTLRSETRDSISALRSEMESSFRDVAVFRRTVDDRNTRQDRLVAAHAESVGTWRGVAVGAGGLLTLTAGILWWIVRTTSDAVTGLARRVDVVETILKSITRH